MAVNTGKPTAGVTLRLTVADKRTFGRLARKRKVSPSTLARQLVEQYITDQRTLEREAARQRTQAVKS